MTLGGRPLVGMLASFLLACGGASAVPGRTTAPRTAVASATMPASGVPVVTEDLQPILASRPDRFGSILANPATYRAEVLFTRVVRDRATRAVKLVRYGYRVDAEYFYPASAIKLCAAVAALEKLGELRARSPGLDANTPLAFYERTGIEERDSPDAKGQKISIGRELRKMLIVSDNRSFNRLFGFVGHRGINERMWRLGLESVRVHGRLMVPATDDGRETPRIDMLGREKVTIPAETSTLSLPPMDVARTLVGESYFGANNQLVYEPMSFGEKNRISLEDLQDLLIMTTRPELAPHAPRLEPGERALLLDALSTSPRASKDPVFDPQPDEVQKPLFIGLPRVAPRDSLRVYGKAGRAYGFTIENEYVVDTARGRAFYLTAAIYTNASGRVGGDVYEYVEIANPFMANLAEVLGRIGLGADPAD